MARNVPLACAYATEFRFRMWEGYTAGVSRESGKIWIFAMQIYGSDQGVGHYVWWGRTNMFNREYSEGHVNMMPFLQYGDPRNDRDIRILEFAANKHRYQ